MVKAAGIGMAVLCLAGSTHAQKASADPCRMRIGHERPQGCAPYRSPTPKPSARVESGERRPGSSAVKAPSDPWIQALREPQKLLKKRSQRLLIQELNALERLLKATPEKAPERARLIRRIADGYAELETLAALEKIRATLKLEEARRRAREARSKQSRDAAQ